MFGITLRQGIEREALSLLFPLSQRVDARERENESGCRQAIAQRLTNASVRAVVTDSGHNNKQGFEIVINDPSRKICLTKKLLLFISFPPRSF
jgi:hypothetical protein